MAESWPYDDDDGTPLGLRWVLLVEERVEEDEDLPAAARARALAIVSWLRRKG